MIDTHTHLNFEAFKDNWQEVADDAVRAGVEKMIVVGTDLESSKRAVEMAQEHEALYAAVGVHPHHARGIMKKILRPSGVSRNARSAQDGTAALMSEAAESNEAVVNEIRELAGQPKVVAIGEIGLDKHVYQNSKYKIQNSKQEDDFLDKLQEQLFVRQVELAVDLNKPLILHSREVGEEVLELISDVRDSIASLQNDIQGVFHCYEGSKKYLKRILEAGFYVSFTGNITYSHDRAEVAKMVPLNRLLLETDSPLILPEPLRSVISTSPDPSLARRGTNKLVNTPVASV